MATIDRPSSAVDLARLRAFWGRLWRPMMAQRPAVRWGLAVAAVSGAGGGELLGRGSLSTIGRSLSRFQQSGFPPTTSSRCVVPSTSSRVAYRVDEQRRVEVASDQFDQAADVVAKLDLGQHPIDEIRDGAGLVEFLGRTRRTRAARNS